MSTSEYTKAWRAKNVDKCRAWRRKYDAKNKARKKEYERHYKRFHYYGVTREEFQSMLIAQGGKCAICKSEEWPGRDNIPTIDHDHATGKIRSLLCGRCNSALGHIHDDLIIAREIVRYLEIHRTEMNESDGRRGTRLPGIEVEP